MKNKWIYLFLILFLILSLRAGSYFYPGSIFIYGIFSLATALMLAFCFFQKTFVGPIFLSFFLFMGLWFKATVHFVTNNDFVEPTGRFDFLAPNWDETLIVASMGLLGFVLISKVLMWLTHKKVSEIKMVSIPSFYSKYRVLLYGFTLILILTFAFINMKFGIHQIGLRPQTIWPWPMNAIISFLINFGFISLLSIYLYWDLTLQKNAFLGLGALVLSASLLSMSVLSRGMYFIQLIPFLFVFFVYRKIVWKEVLYLVVLFPLFLIVTVAGTTVLRQRVYPQVGAVTTPAQDMLIRLQVLDGGIADAKKKIKYGEDDQARLKNFEIERQAILDRLAQNQSGDRFNSKAATDSAEIELEQPIWDKKDAKPIQKEVVSGPIMDVVNLALTRFIGIEGLMAMQSYPKKSYDLFYSALVEKRSLNEPTLYQYVAKSNYRYSDMNVWQFATLPGMLAFLYYAGSVLFVFFGMIIVGAGLILLEIALSRWTNYNYILVSLVMTGMASTCAQFGVTPRQDVLYYSMVISFVFISYLVIRLLKSEKIKNV